MDTLKSQDSSNLTENAPAQQGVKEEEFIRLLMGSYRALYLYARTLVPDAVDAEECVQEASLHLWRRFDEFDRRENFSRWARGFVRKIVKNFHRKMRPSYLAFDDDLIDRLASVQGASQELLELRRERLAGCVERLSTRDRKLIRAYYEYGESVGALSRRLGVSEAAVYQALRRTRLMLFECVQRALDKDGEAK